LNGCWDYGPLGVELLKNIKEEWWKAMTYRDDVEGIDASILMHPKVWEASGHVENFTDPMIDCKQCKSRFRLDVLGDSFNEKKKKKVIDSLKKKLIGSEELINKINYIYENGGIEINKLFSPQDVRDNQYLILKNGKKSALTFVNPVNERIEKVEKRSVYGIKPRNAEQTFAIHAILNPEVKLVTLNGVAGTGKTLIALAAAMEQKRDFKQIYLARPIVPLSNKDIGFLPGDIKSKVNPYMEPLWDNLKFIQNQFHETDREFTKIADMVTQEKLVITPLAYIRGRSLSNIIFIVDEAQNLTPHEVKTIITRAGENSKFIFTGDIYQIDTPYLDSQSNGLSYLIDRVKDHPLYAHITLEKGERSELANLANELL
jgi:PhoH-like ATPase